MATVRRPLDLTADRYGVADGRGVGFGGHGPGGVPGGVKIALTICLIRWGTGITVEP